MNYRPDDKSYDGDRVSKMPRPILDAKGQCSKPAKSGGQMEKRFEMHAQMRPGPSIPNASPSVRSGSLGLLTFAAPGPRTQNTGIVSRLATQLPAKRSSFDSEVGCTSFQTADRQIYCNARNAFIERNRINLKSDPRT